MKVGDLVTDDNGKQHAERCLGIVVGACLSVANSCSMYVTVMWSRRGHVMRTEATEHWAGGLHIVDLT